MIEEGYYNPDNPEENIAERNNSPILVIFGCFLSAVSLFGLIDTGRKIYSHTASNSSPPPIPNDDDDLENPLDYHVEIQVTEHQLENQETIEIKLPFQESTFSFQLKPEMRSKKVRLRGVLSKGAGHLFVQICVIDSRNANFDSGV